MAVAPTLSAINAYRSQLKLAQEAINNPGQEDESQKSSFADLVSGALREAADTERKTDALKMESLTTGKVELSDLVTAVTNAELTLNTVVAVRDRVINAYQEILRMPI